MGVPDFSGLAYLAAIGLGSIFLIILPALGALGWLLFARLVWGEWYLEYAYIGDGIGLLPAIIMGIYIIKCEWEKRHD